MEATGARILEAGTTKDQVSLGRTDSGVFVISLVANKNVNGENRWTLAFTEAIHKAFDAIELELEKKETGPASLLVVSESPKFFSNGVDTDYFFNPPEGIDLAYWNLLVMPAFIRPIMLPIPTVCAINGHAFGAGLMFACGFDYRLQRSDRGYIAANEVQLGVRTPGPEFTLFRSAMPLDMFQQAMITGRRWNAKEALQAGFVQEIASGEELLSAAMKKATELSKLGTKPNVVKYYKSELKGYVAQEVLHFIFGDGSYNSSGKPLPPGLLKHVNDLVHADGYEKTWGKRHRDLEYFKNIKHKM